MGGEPLCKENLLLTFMVLQEVKKRFPKVKVYIWSGYYYEQLLEMSDPKIKAILEMTDVLIDGPYIERLRDVALHMRGSSNQNIINLEENKDV